VSDQPKLVMYLSEAAEFLGTQPKQLYERTRARSRVRTSHPIPHLYIGRRLAFRKSSLEKWVADLEAETMVRQ